MVSTKIFKNVAGKSLLSPMTIKGDEYCRVYIFAAATTAADLKRPDGVWERVAGVPAVEDIVSQSKYVLMHNSVVFYEDIPANTTVIIEVATEPDELGGGIAAIISAGWSPTNKDVLAALTDVNDKLKYKGETVGDSFTNKDVLSKLDVNAEGKLLYDSKIVGKDPVINTLTVATLVEMHASDSAPLTLVTVTNDPVDHSNEGLYVATGVNGAYFKIRNKEALSIIKSLPSYAAIKGFIAGDDNVSIFHETGSQSVVVVDPVTDKTIFASGFQPRRQEPVLSPQSIIDTADLEIEKGAIFDLPRITVIDTVDGEIIAWAYNKSNDFNTNVPGVYTVKYAYSTSGGYWGFFTKKVTVKENNDLIVLGVVPSSMKGGAADPDSVLKGKVDMRIAINDNGSGNSDYEYSFDNFATKTTVSGTYAVIADANVPGYNKGALISITVPDGEKTLSIRPVLNTSNIVGFSFLDSDVYAVKEMKLKTPYSAHEGFMFCVIGYQSAPSFSQGASVATNYVADFDWLANATTAHRVFYRNKTLLGFGDVTENPKISLSLPNAKSMAGFMECVLATTNQTLTKTYIPALNAPVCSDLTQCFLTHYGATYIGKLTQPTVLFKASKYLGRAGLAYKTDRATIASMTVEGYDTGWDMTNAIHLGDFGDSGWVSFKKPTFKITPSNFLGNSELYYTMRDYYAHGMALGFEHDVTQDFGNINSIFSNLQSPNLGIVQAYNTFHANYAKVMKVGSSVSLFNSTETPSYPRYNTPLYAMNADGTVGGQRGTVRSHSANNTDNAVPSETQGLQIITDKAATVLNADGTIGNVKQYLIYFDGTQLVKATLENNLTTAIEAFTP